MNTKRVRWHVCPEMLCKDCWYVFYPQYRGQYMTCFCNDPVKLDWTPEYVRIIGDHPEKVIYTGEEYPCCFTIDLTDWQQDIRTKMLFANPPTVPTVRDYSNYYKQNIEWKKKI